MVSFCRVNEIKVAYTLSGNGPPLLLMHGAEGSHRMFDQIIPPLAEHFTVIAYDQRDCGDTENPETSASLFDLAHDAEALLRALGYRKANVYGTSFGGRVAQVFALCHPESVDRLVLGSTWPLPHALDELNGDAVNEIATLRGRLPASAEALAEYFFPASFLNVQPHLKDIFKSARPESERSQRRFRAVGDCPALDLGDVVAPTLLIAGELDRVVPAQLTTGMATLIKDSEAIVLDGVGHAGCLQAPEVIARRIRRFCISTAKNGV
jgi:pimeloyl-ACP methyl ester carboxylesterase